MTATNDSTLIIRSLGLHLYEPIWEAMKAFTLQRNEKTDDEIWLLEHFPVFTLGQNGKKEDLLSKTSIPLLQTDRGGQITYHGKGQLICYFLIDLKRKKFNVRQFVTRLEETVIDLLNEFNIESHTTLGAPGIYVQGKKIASLGLRIKRFCSYHGLALNVDMDLKPFSDINPCGIKALEMTQVKNYNSMINLQKIAEKFPRYFLKHLGYTNLSFKSGFKACKPQNNEEKKN